MRSELEIQRAHDLLVGVILKEIPMELPMEHLERLSLIAGAFCWVLRHDHQKTCAEILRAIEAEAARLGYGLAEKEGVL